MKATIYCKATDKGIHTFYLRSEGCDYYLFRQNYRRGVNEYFRDGVRLDDALNFSRAKGDNAIKRTMEKLPKHIEYIEREYDLEILRKTAKKNAKHYKRAA